MVEGESGGGRVYRSKVLAPDLTLRIPSERNVLYPPDPVTENTVIESGMNTLVPPARNFLTPVLTVYR